MYTYIDILIYLYTMNMYLIHCIIYIHNMYIYIYTICSAHCSTSPSWSNLSSAETLEGLQWVRGEVTTCHISTNPWPLIRTASKISEWSYSTKQEWLLYTIYNYIFVPIKKPPRSEQTFQPISILQRIPAGIVHTQNQPTNFPHLHWDILQGVPGSGYTASMRFAWLHLSNKCWFRWMFGLTKNYHFLRWLEQHPLESVDMLRYDKL